MKKKLTSNVGAPVADNQNSMTAGKRGPLLLQDVWFLEKLAHFDREVIPERRMHAKGSGAFGNFTVTHDITRVFPRWPEREAQRMRKGISGVLPLNFIRKKGTGIWWATIRLCFSCAIL
jgi:hypothetical protein